MARRFRDAEEQLDILREERRHGSREDREPGEPLSWREKDRRKDRSSHSAQGGGRDSGPKEPEDRYASAQAQKALKGQLDALFSDKEGAALRAAVLTAEGRGGLQQALDAFLEARGGFPPDPELLERALDARRDKTVRKALEVMASALAESEPSQRKVLLLKMRGLARRTFDGKAAKQMKALVAEHGLDD